METRITREQSDGGGILTEQGINIVIQSDTEPTVPRKRSLWTILVSWILSWFS